MNAKCSKSIASCRDGPNLLFHSNVPKLDLSISAPTDQLPHASALHVYINDPLLVTTPGLLQGGSWFLALVENANTTITIASNKYITRYLVGSQRCDAGS